MSPSSWLGFLALSALAVLTPGPTMLAIVGHAAGSGFRRTVPMILGNALGIGAVVAISIAGLTGTLLRAPTVLTVLQLAGAAYLAWSGVKTWIHRAEPLPVTGEGTATGPLGRGFLLVWANPKALLFFGAVLPQFVREDHSLGLQFVEIAATFLVLELAMTTLVAAAAGRLVRTGTGAGLARLRGAGGLLLTGAALFLALTALR